MSKLSYSKNRFWFKTKSHVAKASNAGLQFDRESLQWWTRNISKAVKLRQFADESAEQQFKKHFITHFALPESIPYPDNLDPRISQLTSAWHCLSRSPVYDADEAGLGKTITSILCFNAVPGKTLIICPPFLKYNWEKEFHRWTKCQSPFKFDPPILTIIEDGKAVAADKNWNSDIVILPDSLLANKLTATMIKAHKWKWIIVDEAHRYKSDDAKRTGALIEIAKSSERVVFLSGTPIPNGRPIELYPLLSSLAPEAIGWHDREEFGRLYCGGKRKVHFERGKARVTWDFNHASRLPQLRRGLRKTLMVRHLKKDVLSELGPKTRKIIFLDQPENIKEMEKKVLKNHTLDDLLGEDHTRGEVATYRREIGESKVRPALEYIIDQLENDPGKLVVFAHHVDVVEDLFAGLSKYAPLLIRGGMKSSAKNDRIKLFQGKKGHRVLVGNIDSCGIGNTMTASCRAIFVEYSWNPGVNEQAEDRIHRITQSQHVYIQYLVQRNSLDERMLYQVLRKQDSITQVMD
jgi:SWI/SNF-related matrix-associated actin-dependent regulator of chromatin subfamily A-like protein 1